MSNPVERKINDRRRVERENLAQDQAADDGDTQRTAKLRTHAGTERQGQTAKQRGHGGHHNGPEAQETRFVDGIQRSLPFLALGFQREVNHHDGVLLHDADQQDDAYQSDDAEFGAAQQQSQNCAHTGGRQRRQNGYGMDVTFVENAQHDVHGYERSQNQNWLIRERAQESGGGSLEGGLNARRHADLVLGGVNGVHGLAQGCVGSKGERKGNHRELSLMIDG